MHGSNNVCEGELCTSGAGEYQWELSFETCCDMRLDMARQHYIQTIAVGSGQASATSSMTLVGPGGDLLRENFSASGSQQFGSDQSQSWEIPAGSYTFRVAAQLSGVASAQTGGAGQFVGQTTFDVRLFFYPHTSVPSVASELSLALDASPNPSSGWTHLAFTIPEAGLHELAVFDAVGRRIRTLSEGAADSGVHETAWDGRDDAGSAVPTGMYVFRLGAAEGLVTQKGFLTR